MALPAGACERTPTPMRHVAEWAEEFREFWKQRYDRLDDYLRTTRGGWVASGMTDGFGRGYERLEQTLDTIA